jgi:hypothetical protein
MARANIACVACHNCRHSSCDEVERPVTTPVSGGMIVEAEKDSVWTCREDAPFCDWSDGANYRAVWPVVDLDDWCSKWSPDARG